MNKAVQIAADDLYPSRRQTAVIAVLCRGFVDNEGTNQMQQAGLPDSSAFPDKKQPFLTINGCPHRFTTISHVPSPRHTCRRLLLHQKLYKMHP